MVDGAPAQLGVADVQQRRIVFKPIQPRRLLTSMLLQETAESEALFFRTLYDSCLPQPPSGFPLVFGIHNQSRLESW